jgi:hypothetical protein
MVNEYIGSIMNKKLFIIKSFTLLALTCSSSLCFAIPPDEEEQEQQTTLSSPAESAFAKVPDEITIKILSYGTLEESMRYALVSHKWQDCSNHSALWQSLGQGFAADYPPESWTHDKSKQTFITHFLRMKANTLNTPAEINALSARFPFILTVPGVRYASTIDVVVNNISLDSIELWVVRGNEQAIKRKLDKLEYGGCGYAAAVIFNETLIDKGNEEAIKRKLNGLEYGKHGYKKNPVAAKMFNDTLVAQGNKDAIARQINGLKYGRCGYERNYAAAVTLNETLIAQGEEDAIRRKLNGLEYGWYGYEKNPVAAVTFNETLIAQGDEDAIRRKLERLEHGGYGYEKNLTALKEFIEASVAEDNKDAIERKLEGLKYGWYGYEANHAALQAFNETLVAQGNKEAISRKIQGLLHRSIYGYERNHALVPPMIEGLIQNEKTSRLGHYLKAFAMKYGILGFAKNDEDANAYIRDYQIAY